MIYGKNNDLHYQQYWQTSNIYNTKPHAPAGMKPLSWKDKSVIAASSVAGMLPVIAFLAHRSGFSLNPARILKTPVKDWALFSYKSSKKHIKFKEPQIISIAAGSVAGGFAGGVAVDDKSNIKAKKREVLNQLLGDVAIPIACVGLGVRIFNRFEPQIIKLMPKITENSRIANIIKPKIFNNISENIPSGLATIVSLGIGIIAGNRVSNEINERMYHQKVERGIRLTDFAPHFDDLCMAISMMKEKSDFGSKLARIIPLALIVPGYETGTARKHEE